ncbi:hypothetical protein SLA2020_493500 [Shorea laevis]
MKKELHLLFGFLVVMYESDIYESICIDYVLLILLCFSPVCTKVKLYFVSPKNLDECFRITEEFSVLPHNHRAKEDKLELKKITIHAMCTAVNFLERNTK